MKIKNHAKTKMLCTKSNGTEHFYLQLCNQCVLSAVSDLLKICLKMNLTIGPAKNNCQQSAIGKLSAVVSSHTEIISTPAFLKIRVAARLIRGHIKITEIAEIASTRRLSRKQRIMKRREASKIGDFE